MKHTSKLNQNTEKHFIHLCRKYILINWTSPFPILLGGLFHLYSNFKKKHFRKQTMKNLIRRSDLRRLIWFCNVCRCPTERTIGLYGLILVASKFGDFTRLTYWSQCNLIVMVSKLMFFQVIINSRGDCF